MEKGRGGKGRGEEGRLALGWVEGREGGREGEKRRDETNVIPGTEMVSGLDSSRSSRTTKKQSWWVKERVIGQVGESRRVRERGKDERSSSSRWEAPKVDLLLFDEDL